ncbi:MAG: hypothetical protein IJ060_03265 [Oscillospiraceae bacterium]|nr:hypothetical protein [Oscillospiraceae bacterium]
MNSNLFPIGLEKHIIFVIIATAFFILQFIRTKRWYQLVMAAAFCVSLLIYTAPDNKAVFYGIGITEAVLLLASLVLNIIQSVRISREEKAKKAAEEAQKAAESGEKQLKELTDDKTGTESAEEPATAAEAADSAETEA